MRAYVARALAGRSRRGAKKVQQRAELQVDDDQVNNDASRAPEPDDLTEAEAEPGPGATETEAAEEAATESRAEADPAAVATEAATDGQAADTADTAESVADGGPSAEPAADAAAEARTADPAEPAVAGPTATPEVTEVTEAAETLEASGPAGPEPASSDPAEGQAAPAAAAAEGAEPPAAETGQPVVEAAAEPAAAAEPTAEPAADTAGTEAATDEGEPAAAEPPAAEPAPAVAAAVAAAGDAEPSEAVLADLVAARAKAEGYLDDLRRLQAEFDNYRKRTMREQTARIASASQALVSRLLPVLDNFELAVSHAEQSRDFDRMLKGVEMVFGELQELLSNEGLVAIEAEGKPFDPERHEAVVAVEQEGVEAGTVVDVIRKGYEFNGRVLRPAMVKVAR